MSVDAHVVPLCSQTEHIASIAIKFCCAARAGRAGLEGYTTDGLLTEVPTEKMHEFLTEAAGRKPFFLYMAEYALVDQPLEEREALMTTSTFQRRRLRSALKIRCVDFAPTTRSAMTSRLVWRTRANRENERVQYA
jgi:hypothetical protein